MTHLMDFRHLTGVKLAGIYRLTTSAISAWHVKDGCPRNADGSYDLSVVIGWREGRIQAAADRAAEAGSGSVALERWRVARAAQEEIRLAAMTGEYLPRAEVEEGRVARVLTLKRAMLGLPRAVAPVLAGMEPREIQAYLTDRIRAMIGEFAGVTKVRK